VSLRRYALRRCLLGLVQALLVVTLVFALIEALPGDAAVVLAGDTPDPARIARLRDELHLDDPVWSRYLTWLGALLHGDLGDSLLSGRPVASFLAAGFPATLVLAALTLLVVLPFSVGLGCLAALRRGRLTDRVLTATGIAAHAVPEFAAAVLLVAVFSLQLGWLPPTAVGVTSLLREPAVLVLPVLVLALRPICSISRLVRAGLVGTLEAAYVQQAGRLGVPRRRAVWAHALPPALAPAAQQVARTVDWLLGGVIVVEALFALPGLGTTLLDAVNSRDLPVVQGLAVVFALTAVGANLAADLVTFRLSPRFGAVL
jgi:peptide/nickel transport system permease protein